MSSLISRVWNRALTEVTQLKYKHRHKTARIDHRVNIISENNIVMEEHTNIEAGAFILNMRAKFIMKKWSGAAVGLTVVTGTHVSVPGKHHKMVTNKDKDQIDVNHEYDKDVIVEEDVWIASNVTLLQGITVGRGAIVGAGAVVRSNIPPYAIVMGNPAKVVGFRFTPGITVQHEELLYPESERLSEELLEENYNKYFISRIRDIQSYLSI